jgi:hypothetical protein
MLDAGVGRRIAERAWSGYQHQFAGNSPRAERSTADVDFDSRSCASLPAAAHRQRRASTDSPRGRRDV